MGLGLEINIYHIFVEILCNCITHVTIIKKNPYLLTYLLILHLQGPVYA